MSNSPAENLPPRLAHHSREGGGAVSGAPEKTISQILADLGVTHERDRNSISSGKHRLYFAGRHIGDYDAHDVGALIREHLFGGAA